MVRPAKESFNEIADLRNVNSEVYVSDFGLARVQDAEGQVATTKQNFGPIAVRIRFLLAITISSHEL